MVREIEEGFLHEPVAANGHGLVLTHGAGANAKAPLLVAAAELFCAAGFVVLRCDMAFRKRKAFGPPHPSTGALDRASLREASSFVRGLISGKLMLGGHSYGGRQSTMLAAEEPEVAEALLLLSYPLHPPAKPEQLRTAHFPQLRTPSLFVHGTKDPFGTIEEMQAALKLIPAPTQLMVAEKAGHPLGKSYLDEVVARGSSMFM
jgi:predicted alpha/beta-hydrolase family hydrolase